ncbi:YeiH family protein [Roseivirga sp. E12]|uniref:YeiH family protein n=1 Tax=Roseivirga sp. E12 TaxID=2819237 RepID=UPI001ABC3E6E|nr:putative sulfate exporter family transporter [Roseivirga sp. E12]MBO3699471.1 putative sulfate exporter family transporter [Roseivirga sp. E12]
MFRLLNLRKRHKNALFVLLGLVCLFPLINSQWALLIGLAFRFVIGEIEIKFIPKLCKWLLQTSVVTLGLCINVQQAANVGTENFLYITVSVIMVLSLGWLMSKLVKMNTDLSMLISAGTAICGGSAIASIAPILRASNRKISVALSVVFLLNALAVLVFPNLGFALEMTQRQFGLWCAVAIHDTSSVVGAAAVYGQEALEIATTAKLTRMLWIIPLMLLLSFFRKNDSKLKFPWFVLFFILALISTSIFPLTRVTEHSVLSFSKGLMALVLFLMGSSLQINKSTGLKPVVFGSVLWIFTVVVSAFAILEFY